MATLEISFDKSPQGLLAGPRTRLANVTQVAPAIFQAIRFGPDSVRDQFARQTEVTQTGASAWKKTQQFGTRAPGSRTLYRTGAYEKAWTGRGPGGITKSGVIAGGVRFSVGIDGGVFKQARMFQSRTATTVHPKKRTKGGQYAMRYKLGLTFGAWISNARLEKGLTVQPRRVGLGLKVRDRAKAILLQWITKGRAQLGVAA